MRIIKDGDPITKRFKCDECGCIFEAGITEYNKHQYFDVMNGFTTGYTCECPYCSNEAKEDKEN